MGTQGIAGKRHKIPSGPGRTESDEKRENHAGDSRNFPVGESMKQLIIKEMESGQRLDKFLGKYLKEAPKSFIYKMLRKKNITLNGGRATGNEKLSHW